MAATSPTNAWAVGRYHNGTTTQTLIEHWNGTAWKREPSPNQGGSTTENTLVGVAATSPTNAWAVGSYGREPNLHTLVLHWNGTAWKIQPSPSPRYASLSSVAATSPTDAWAVGSRAAFTRTLIEHWNGRVWQVQQSPSPGMGADLFSVTATSGKNAWAVGGITDESGRPVRTVIERWNGRAWTVQRNPRLGGAQFYGVAATSAKNAWAVGSYYPSYTSHALIERWNGRVWQVQKHRYPGGRTRDNGLDSVAATSSTNAWAVGFYRGKQRHLRTLALHWNGTAWCP